MIPQLVFISENAAFLFIFVNSMLDSPNFLPYVDSEATISYTRPTLWIGLMTLCLKI